MQERNRFEMFDADGFAVEAESLLKCAKEAVAFTKEEQETLKKFAVSLNKVLKAMQIVDLKLKIQKLAE